VAARWYSVRAARWYIRCSTAFDPTPTHPAAQLRVTPRRPSLVGSYGNLRAAGGHEEPRAIHVAGAQVTRGRREWIARVCACASRAPHGGKLAPFDLSTPLRIFLPDRSRQGPLARWQWSHYARTGFPDDNNPVTSQATSGVTGRSFIWATNASTASARTTRRQPVRGSACLRCRRREGSATGCRGLSGR
jgi:hypothetical protein